MNQPQPTAPIRVTIAVVVYNGERYLSAALESALAQTHRDIEVLVVDDGSTDGSVELVRGFCRRSSRVRFHRHERNLGIGAAMRTCVGLVATEWFVILEQDDLLLPDCVARQLAVLAAFPEAAVISGRAHLIDESGKRIGAAYHAPMTVARLRELVERCEPPEMVNPGSLVHRPSVLAVGNYREELRRFGQDLDMVARLAEGGYRLVNHDGFVVENRVHGLSSTFSLGPWIWAVAPWQAARMRCRRELRPEPSWEEFLRDLDGRPALTRLAFWRGLLLKHLYWRARLAAGQGGWPGVAWRLALAFCLSPRFVWDLAWRKVSARLDRPPGQPLPRDAGEGAPDK
ncbi:MAG: glycosyltransferase [Candidatus Riflebacteria bacterium]|nr:glycosyltransferase [Candidatus Riflebacteria bacterium]